MNWVWPYPYSTRFDRVNVQVGENHCLGKKYAPIPYPILSGKRPLDLGRMKIFDQMKKLSIPYPMTSGWVSAIGYYSTHGRSYTEYVFKSKTKNIKYR